MSEFLVRRGDPAEAAIYLDLWRVADAEPSVSDDVESIERLFAVDREAMLVAELDGVVVGTLIAAFDGWRGTFYRLAVHPSARRRGIAARLVSEGERRLVALGCRKVEAIVIEARGPSVDFWNAAGYQRDNRVGRYTRELTNR